MFHRALLYLDASHCFMIKLHSPDELLRNTRTHTEQKIIYYYYTERLLPIITKCLMQGIPMKTILSGLLFFSSCIPVTGPLWLLSFS